MAVAWARQVASRKWSEDWNGKAPVTKATKVYLVKCDDKTDTPDIAANADDIDSSSAYAPDAPGLQVVLLEAEEKERTGDGGTIYAVTIEYSTSTIDPDQRDPNPLNRARIVKLSFDTYEETTFIAPKEPDAVDGNGNVIQNKWIWKQAVCNSAGQAFDPSVTEIFRDPVVTIQQNMAELPWDLVKGYIDTVNADAFTITYRGNTYPVLPGQAWLCEIESDPKYENGVAYEEVRVVLKIREDGWKRKFMDQGTEQLNNGDTPTRPILDANGDPVRRPVLLDGSGAALKSLNKNPTPVFLRWQFKDDSLNFSALPFFK
jgi:hypothetical protein